MKRLLLAMGIIAAMAPFTLAQAPTPGVRDPAQATQASAPPALAMASPDRGERSAAQRLLGRPRQTAQQIAQQQQGQQNRSSGTVQTGQQGTGFAVSNVVLHPLEAEQVRRAQIDNDRADIENAILLQQESNRLAVETANAQAAAADNAEWASRRELEWLNHWKNDAQHQFIGLMHTQQELMGRSIATQDQIVHNRRHYFDTLNAQKWDNWNRSRETIGYAFGDLSPIAAGILNRISHGDEDQIDAQFQHQFNAQQSGMMGDIDRLRREQGQATLAVQENLRIRMEMLTRRTDELFAQRAQLYQPAGSAPNQPTRPQQR